MKISQIYSSFFILSAIISLLSLSGCNDGKEGDNPAETGSPLVRVQADIDFNRQARGYQAEGTVVDGTYNLTFPTTVANQYNIGEVRFGLTTENPQIGYVTLPGNSSLKWLSVGGGSTPTLYLDNIPRTLNGTTNATEIIFSSTDNPYIAAPFDSIGGSNDLLWSSQMFQRNSGTLHFDLLHQMARVRLMITTDNTYGEIDLTDATVEITNLNQSPVSFNRLDGTFTLNTDAEAYSDLVFVKPDDASKNWINIYTPSDEKKVYQTPDFVLPPQDLLQDDRRPKLIITLSNGV